MRNPKTMTWQIFQKNLGSTCYGCEYTKICNISKKRNFFKVLVLKLSSLHCCQTSRCILVKKLSLVLSDTFKKFHETVE